MRLDQLLVEKGLFASRSRARDAIVRGTVTVDHSVVTKPGATFSDAAVIGVDDPASGYVSRAALKLIAGLDQFSIDVRDRSALDIGASTGGFTQNGANASTYVATSWHIAQVGDFNGDGKDDILWRDDSGHTTNWLGTASGGFTPNSANFSTTVDTSWHIEHPLL